MLAITARLVTLVHTASKGFTQNKSRSDFKSKHFNFNVKTYPNPDLEHRSGSTYSSISTVFSLRPFDFYDFSIGRSEKYENQLLFIVGV
jgi:hypothetical protein